jgi:hypothetical protein
MPSRFNLPDSPGRFGSGSSGSGSSGSSGNAGTAETTVGAGTGIYANQNPDVLGTVAGSNLGIASGQWAGLEANRLLASDVEAMKKGELGMSQAEKDQASQMQAAGAAMQAQTQQQELARNQMAGGGYSGQYAEAARGVGDVAAQTEATARAEQDEISRQQAEARRAEILGRVERQQELGIAERHHQGAMHNERAGNISEMLAMMPI